MDLVVSGGQESWLRLHQLVEDRWTEVTSTSRSPVELVLSLVQVINANAPRRLGEELLDSKVHIEMDAVRHSGIKTWYMWIHLIRNCGRISELRLTNCRVWCDAHNPNVVCLSGRWTGIARFRGKPEMSAADVELHYLVRDDRIVFIRTRKSNYVFIFGSWIKYAPGYWLFLAWAYLYFKACRLRGIDYVDGSM
jgi:hypothetical protein